MTDRYFTIHLEADAILRLDQKVIDVVDDDWRSYLYNIFTPEEIAEMIGRCMIAYHSRLSGIDGWADQPDEYAELVIGPEWYEGDVRELDPDEVDLLLKSIGRT